MQAFQALIALGNFNGTCCNGQVFFRMEAVVTGGDRKAAACDRHRAVAVHGIIGSVHVKNTVSDHQLCTGLDTLHAGTVRSVLLAAGIAAGSAAHIAGSTAHAAGMSAHVAPIVRGNRCAVFAAAACQDRKCAAVDLHGCCGADAVALCGNLECATAQIDRAQGGIVAVFCVNAVLTGRNGKAAVGDCHIVLAGKAMGSAGNFVDAASHCQRILGYDSVTCRGGNGELALTVEGKVLFGIDSTVHILPVSSFKAASVGKGIFCACRSRHKNLVRLLHIQCRPVAAADGCARQHQLDFFILLRTNPDLTVLQCAAENIGALCGNGDGASVHGHAAAAAGRRVPLQGDAGALVVVTAVKVPVGKIVFRGQHRFSRRCGSTLRLLLLRDVLLLLVAAAAQ